MKYFLPFFFIIVLFGAGCHNKSPKTQTSDDCLNAEYTFACFLDKALASKDPNLCNQSAISRITCLTAYEEIMALPVNCSDLTDPLFVRECKDYKESEMQNKNFFEEDMIQDDVSPVVE